MVVLDVRGHRGGRRVALSRTIGRTTRVIVTVLDTAAKVPLFSMLHSRRLLSFLLRGAKTETISPIMLRPPTPKECEEDKVEMGIFGWTWSGCWEV